MEISDPASTQRGSCIACLLQCLFFSDLVCDTGYTISLYFFCFCFVPRGVGGQSMHLVKRVSAPYLYMKLDNIFHGKLYPCKMIEIICTVSLHIAIYQACIMCNDKIDGK